MKRVVVYGLAGLLFAGVATPVAVLTDGQADKPARADSVDVTGHGRVPVRDLNVLGCTEVTCEVQYDPSQDAEDFTGWTGAASAVDLSRALGFDVSSPGAPPLGVVYYVDGVPHVKLTHPTAEPSCGVMVDWVDTGYEDDRGFC